MVEEIQEIVFIGINSSTIFMLIGLIGMLLLSGLMSGAEAAFFSFSHRDIEKIKESKNLNDKAIMSLLTDIDLLLATILVVNNLVNICIAIFAAHIIDATIDFGGSTLIEFIVKTIIVTFILLLFGEIAPKVLAQTAPRKFAIVAARPIIVLRTICRPLSKMLLKAGSTIGSKAAHHSEISMNDLANAVDMTESSSKEEKFILSGIVNFVNTDVQAIMRTRIDIKAIPLTENIEGVKKLIMSSGYSRIPVYEENLDNIRGVLFVKDLIAHINEVDFKWQKLIKKPYFVPAHKKINTLLEEFQTTKNHMAIVADEYGSTMGLISLEDIIEEIVGEISDESDREEQFYARLDRNTYIFEGKTHINDFKRVLNLDDSVFDGINTSSETLAGLILDVKMALPKLGDRIMIKGISITVNTMGGHSGRRVEKVRVITPDTPISID